MKVIQSGHGVHVSSLPYVSFVRCSIITMSPSALQPSAMSSETDRAFFCGNTFFRFISFQLNKGHAPLHK